MLAVPTAFVGYLGSVGVYNFHVSVEKSTPNSSKVRLADMSVLFDYCRGETAKKSIASENIIIVPRLR